MRVQITAARTMLAASLVLVASSPAAGQAPGRRPALDHGPHGVGFRVIEALDSTRAFRPLRDFRGRLADETARPVQVSIWYPARAAADSPRMTAGDFRLLRETEVDFGRTLDAVERARLRVEFIDEATGLGQDPAVAARTWDEQTPAIHDAPPLPGPHPTVLWFTSAGVSNPALPAYLASHGFVVASFPSNGRMTEVSLEFTPNALTLDTDIDDAGFVYGVLRRIPWADTRRLALASFSGGSLAALLWQMRDMQPAAVVTVEGWERYRRGADIVSESIHYEPGRMRVPFLMIERAPDEASPAYAKVPDVVGALVRSDITRIAFRDAAHADFLSHVSFGHTDAQPRVYETSARMIRLFLEQHLMEDDAAAGELAALSPPPDDPFFTIARHPATVAAVPTEEELYRLAETDPAAAAAAYREATSRVDGSALFREAVLTRAATFARSAAARATIMEIVVDAYPDSIRARFNFGQALADSGRRVGAVAALETALALVEGDASLDEPTRAQWRDRIASALDAIRR